MKRIHTIWLLAVMLLVIGIAIYYLFFFTTDRDKKLPDQPTLNTNYNSLPTNYVGYFDTTCIHYLLEKPGCEYIRFYNMLEADTHKVVAVAANADSCDIYADTAESFFTGAVVFSGNNAEETAISRPTLVDNRVLLTRNQLPRFSIIASATEINRILSGYNAIAIKYDQTRNGHTNFSIYGGTIANSEFIPHDQPIIGKDPCPYICPDRPRILSCVDIN